jgi:predicted esterase
VDSSRKYNLIVGLHGLGDNVTNYRNALVSFKWPQYFTNTIFIFPEASSIWNDYYEPDKTGAELIIKEAIKYTCTKYKIDTGEIILQGLSLGGRAALRYGLEHTTEFKALVLNTPAEQEIKEALNLMPCYNFNFANASKIPIFITHGENDINYGHPIDTVFRMLVMNNGVVRLHHYKGLGHTIPSLSLMNDVNSFFDHPETSVAHAEINSLFIPVISCDKYVQVGVLVRNVGEKEIQSLNISLQSGSHIKNMNFDVKLKPFEYGILSFKQFALDTGLQTIVATIDSVNNESDTLVSNNKDSSSTRILGTQANLPYYTAFDGPEVNPEGWTLNLSGEPFF